MAWETLEAYIDSHILDKLPLKISADNDHNPTLHEIVDTFGAGYMYSGVAHKTFTPINDDKKRFYMANGGVGDYVNFLDDGGSVLSIVDGEFALFKGVDNVWAKDSVEENTLFLLADDTPTTYASAGGYGVFVKTTEDGLEFLPTKQFTTAKDDKLDGIEDDATADQDADEVDISGYVKPSSSSAIADGDSVQDALGKLEASNDHADDFAAIGGSFETTGDDKGMKIDDGQLSVGSMETPHEAVVGEGDSYPVPYAYHCDISQFTGTTVTGTATDISTILQSDDSSTTGLFGGTSSGYVILVGSDYPFGGAKIKISTAMVNGGTVVGEYLKDSTPTWTVSPFMSTLSSFPYTNYGNYICNNDSTSEQLRFGFDPDDIPTTWAKVSLNINGVAIEKYWARFRITSAITTDPVVEQVKLHTNRWECNADGRTEVFGRARSSQTLNFHSFPNADKTPVDENIKLASGITVTRLNNEFANGKDDGLILLGKLPVGLDTSIPLIIDVDWYQSGSTTGDVELELVAVKITDGFIYDGTATSETPVTSIVTVDGTQELKITTQFKVLVNDMLEGDTLALSLHRDATAGNADDTLAGNIVIVDQRVYGYFWR